LVLLQIGLMGGEHPADARIVLATLRSSRTAADGSLRLVRVVIRVDFLVRGGGRTDMKLRAAGAQVVHGQATDVGILVWVVVVGFTVFVGSRGGRREHRRAAT
jgi:hypothetical protein